MGAWRRPRTNTGTTGLGHTLAGPYAVDAVAEPERTLVERHLAICADCQDEAATLRETASMLAATYVAAPPAGLRREVMAQIGHARRVRRARRRTSLACAAAAALLAVGLGVAQPWASDEPSPSQQVLRADDARATSVDLGRGVRVTFVVSADVDRAVIRTENMPAPPAGSVYQLWYERDGASVSAGLMPVAEDQTVRLRGDARGADGASLTLEPEGGSPAPTTDPITEFDFGATPPS